MVTSFIVTLIFLFINSLQALDQNVANKNNKDNNKGGKGSTNLPTSIPSPIPTSTPTLIPTLIPTPIPTPVPTLTPTPIPTSVLTLALTNSTFTQTKFPTSIPSNIRKEFQSKEIEKEKEKSFKGSTNNDSEQTSSPTTSKSEETSNSNILVEFSVFFSDDIDVNDSSIFQGENSAVSNSMVSLTTRSICKRNGELIVTPSHYVEEAILNLCGQFVYDDLLAIESVNPDEYQNVLLLQLDTAIVSVKENSASSVKYFEVGVQYNVLQLGTGMGDTKNLQRQLSLSIMDAISSDDFGDGSEVEVGIRAFSIIGKEENIINVVKPKTSINDQTGKVKNIRIVGVSFFLLSIIIIGTLCYNGNYLELEKKGKKGALSSEEGVEEMLQLGSMKNYEESLSVSSGVIG